MINSLRFRLCVAIGLVVLVTGLATAVIAFRFAYDEAIELQDAILLQFGDVLGAGNLPNATHRSEVDKEERMVVEEIGATDPLSSRDNFPDGLHTVTRSHEQWRMLLRSRDDGTRFGIAQRTAFRDENARDSALQSVLPLAVLVPILLILVPLIVSRAFGPMRRLAAKLDMKESDHMADLTTKNMPSEIAPFIASINRLLGRVRMLFEQQSRFVVDAAHELRTPITALSLQAQNLERVQLRPEDRKRLEALLAGIHRTGHLIEQLLTLARFDLAPAQGAASANVNDVVRDIAADLAPIAQEKEIDLGFAQSVSLTVRIDGLALATVLRNLVDNAIRYTPAGGTVDVSVEQRGDIVTITVLDSGPGISEAERERLTERFYRGKTAGQEGSGLGLSIVYRIAERAGGGMAICNRDDGHSGLRVTVDLPAK